MVKRNNEGRYGIAAPDRAQFEQFGYIKKRERVMSLWGYLYDGNDQKTVGNRVFPKESDFSSGEKVLLVLNSHGLHPQVCRSWQQ